MPTILPHAFTNSIRDHENYPHNLLYKTTYPDVLEKLKSDVDSIGKELFVSKDEDANVPFRDLKDDCKSNCFRLLW